MIDIDNISIVII